MPVDLRDRVRALSPVYLAAIAGDSMSPGLVDGDWVVVLRRPRVRPGRAIALRDPRSPGRIVVKRVQRRTTGGWWVRGDNPAASTDSRHFGAVADDLVVGRVLFRYRRAPRR